MDYTLKCIIIGESNAGKSSLLQQFVNGRLNDVSKHTVGVEFGARTIVIPSDECASGSSGTSVVKLQIWDTVRFPSSPGVKQPTIARACLLRRPCAGCQFTLHRNVRFLLLEHTHARVRAFVTSIAAHHGVYVTCALRAPCEQVPQRYPPWVTLCIPPPIATPTATTPRLSAPRRSAGRPGSLP